MTLKLLTKIKETLLELLFPVRCAACEKETGHKKKNKLICSDCLKTTRPSSDFFCPLCEAKTADGKLCFSCRILTGNSDAAFHLDRLLYPFSYKDSAVQKIIKAFKYRFIKDLDGPLGRLVISYLDKIKSKIDLKDTVIIPVPLHKRKFNQRGYNQSELIAAKISESLNIEAVNDCLFKIRPTKDQAKLKEDKRLGNLKNVFLCAKPWLVSGRKILLVDDVYTTGATMNECAKVLKEAGAKEIIGLAIARG
ncbi:MAG: ComF family protein [Parcubacteria group bacterium]|nr:ComF family protein [Parcubacteria group bacterium]